jgi:DNA-binding transcriptional regulator YiaG
MMNAQRTAACISASAISRVGERLAEIRKSRKISQAKLAKLLGVVEGTIQNYEHGRNEPNITRLYDAKRGRSAPCVV